MRSQRAHRTRRKKKMSLQVQLPKVVRRHRMNVNDHTVRSFVTFNHTPCSELYLRVEVTPTVQCNQAKEQ